MRFLLTAVVLMVTTTFLHAQSTTTVTLNPDADAHTASGASSTNYGTADSIPIWVQSSSNYKRGYLHFAMPTGLPTGAIVSSAKLRLTLYGTGAEGTIASNSFVVAVSSTSWTETGIKASGNTADNINLTNVTANAFVSGTPGQREFDVTNHVQAMIDGRIPNYGWTIRRNSETAASTKAKYYSREATTTTYRPQLIITYYTPASVSAATIVHANTLTATNASVSPTISGGSSSTRTYAWYNSSGTQISTSQNLTDVGYGWYGMKSTGTVSGDVIYQAFLVGVQCEEVSINFTPTADYLDDAMIWNSQSGGDLGQSNYGDYGYEIAANEKSTAWYIQKSLMKFRLWMDNGLTVNQANLTLSGFKHDITGRANTSRLTQVTSYWREKGVAYNTLPTSSTSITTSITGTSETNENRTLDIKSFWDSWKASNTTNYGMLFELTSYTSVTTRMQFYSSDASSSLPTIAFKIAIPSSSCDLSTRGTTTFTANSTEGVDVAVNISPPSWAASPYNYFISESQIPDMTDWYAYLRDSVYGGTLDSTSFFGHGSTALSKTFSNQTEGQFYLAVFDAKGKRIYNYSSVYQFPVTLAGASNLTLSGQQFTSGATNPGYGSFDRYLTAFQGGTLIFTPSSSTNSQYYGITESGKTILSSHDIKHGFMISSNQISLISNYTVVGSAMTYAAGTAVRLEMDGKYLSYYLGEDLKFKDSVIDTLYYKPALWMAASTTTKVVIKGINKKPYVLRHLTLTGATDPSNDRSCSNTNLAFKFQVNQFFGGTGSYNYSIAPDARISGLTGTSISGSSSFGTPVTVNNLPPGVYQMSVSSTGDDGGVLKVFYFVVGIRATWLESNLYNYSPNTYSVSSQNTSLAKSITKNVIAFSETSGEWFWFNPVFGTMPYTSSGIFKRYSKYKLYAALTSQYPSAGLSNADSYFAFFRNGIQIYPAYHPTSAAYMNFAAEGYANRRYFILVQGTEVRLYSEYQGTFSTNPLVSITRPSGNLRLETNTFGMASGGFKNVYSTHCIPATTIDQIGHFEAKRDLEAGFTFAYQKTLKFTFDEEYDVPSASNLEYILYDDSHNQLAHYIPSGGSTGSAPALVYHFDDNRFQLDLSPISGIVLDKFYFIEIVTAKGDRRFVKFQSKSSTNDTNQPQNPDEQSN